MSKGSQEQRCIQGWLRVQCEAGAALAGVPFVCLCLLRPCTRPAISDPGKVLDSIRPAPIASGSSPRAAPARKPARPQQAATAIIGFNRNRSGGHTSLCSLNGPLLVVAAADNIEIGRCRCASVVTGPGQTLHSPASTAQAGHFLGAKTGALVSVAGWDPCFSI